MVDSREVTRAIAAEIWPGLRELGFESIQGRVARRKHADHVDILEFNAFNSYEQQRLKLKPGSFSIALGCHLEYITNPIAFNGGETVRLAKPTTPDCLLRGELRRRYVRPIGLDRGIWAIGVLGVPMEKVISSARDAVLGEGIGWFDQFKTPTAVYALIEEREEHMSKLWGFGRPGSPIRHFMLGYAALAAGKQPAARKHLQLALDTQCFPGHAPRMRADAGIP